MVVVAADVVVVAGEIAVVGVNVVVGANVVVGRPRVADVEDDTDLAVVGLPDSTGLHATAIKRVTTANLGIRPNSQTPSLR